ncbi:hypothetical protein KXS11_15415 [Plantibacter flavus]|uniref:hypothetical protein n=1 Tax=Plantibacter flavus TaxID=150123 RepID=UPI003F158E83
MRSTPLVALSILALALGLTACSPGSADPGAGGEQTGASYDDAFDDYQIGLAACMRDRGIDVEDPDPGTAITLDGDASFDAYDACAAELGPPPVNPDQPTRKEIADDFRERAQCLRDKGFDVPDPAADGTWELPEELFDEARACAV